MGQASIGRRSDGSAWRSGREGGGARSADRQRPICLSETSLTLRTPESIVCDGRRPVRKQLERERERERERETRWEAASS